MARLLRDVLEAVQQFIESGGEVLLAIFAVTVLMWMIILERYWYLSHGHRLETKAALDAWKARAERTSWAARQIRRMLVSRVGEQLDRSLPVLRSLIAIGPLLGLLGTVSGMIEVFDVMAVAGSGNPRAMASGVSRATIPTMAGMVAALSGLYFSARLASAAASEPRKLAGHMERAGVAEVEDAA